MKIATTTADFEEYVSSRDDVCRILPMMRDSGFEHIDLNMYRSNQPDSPISRNTWERWADDIAETGARLGVDFVQAHSSDTAFDAGEQHDRELECVRRELRVCQKLGIRGMTIHAIYKPNTTREEFMEANTRYYSELLRVAEETGVMVYTENTCTKNCPTYYLVTGDDMNELRERLDRHPLFGFCWDVGHANVQRLNQYNEIITMGDGLQALHIHDNFADDTHGQPYSGTCSYDQIMKGLVDVGYKGYFTLEAYSLPSPKSFLGRPAVEKDGVVYDKLTTLPLSLKIRSERLMLDVARYILDTYGCLE